MPEYVKWNWVVRVGEMCTMELRLESVRQLKNEYPKHLKNLRDEDFLNGQAKTKIDDLTKSITQNAKAKAALSKITEEANKILAPMPFFTYWKHHEMPFSICNSKTNHYIYQ